MIPIVNLPLCVEGVYNLVDYKAEQVGCSLPYFI